VLILCFEGFGKRWRAHGSFHHNLHPALGWEEKWSWKADRHLPWISFPGHL